jgi:hypothetical protein
MDALGAWLRISSRAFLKRKYLLWMCFIMSACLLLCSIVHRFQRDGRFEYREQLNLLRQNDQTTFIIDLEDVRRYDEGLYGVIKQNYYRLMPNLHKVNFAVFSLLCCWLQRNFLSSPAQLLLCKHDVQVCRSCWPVPILKLLRYFQAASRFAQEATQDEEDGLETYDYWVSFFSTGKDEHIQKYVCRRDTP